MERSICIECTNVHKAFPHQKVLEGLDLKVFESETMVILGPSGVGKSVLLKILLGLLSLDYGDVKIFGQSITALTKDQLYRLLRRMGMLFQGAALFDSMNIEENTSFYLREHRGLADGTHVSPSEYSDRVAEALAKVGLAGTQKKMPSDLSGGMKKRAGLARLLVYRPQVILYDEPTTGLDPRTADSINDLIVQVQAELAATSVVVTHDIYSALRVGDRFALLEEGRVAHIGEPDAVISANDPFTNFLRTHILGSDTPRKGT